MNALFPHVLSTLYHAVPDQSCFTTEPPIDSCTRNCDETCPYRVNSKS